MPTQNEPQNDLQDPLHTESQSEFGREGLANSQDEIGSLDETERRHSSIVSSKDVEGTTVYNGTGDKLGSIDHLMIDKRSGQVRYAVLEFGGFLGIATDRYPIPWNALRYDVEKEGYVVPLDKSRLDGAPRYSLDNPIRYTPDFGRSVDGFYGIDD